MEIATEKMTKLDKAANEAYGSKDSAAIEKLIAADFHFTSPLDNRMEFRDQLDRARNRIAAVPAKKYVPSTSARSLFH